jgi:hypothetical protein
LEPGIDYVMNPLAAKQLHENSGLFKHQVTELPLAFIFT